MGRVFSFWAPNRLVEESSLHVQISALRNAFGADRDLIRTISDEALPVHRRDPHDRGEPD